MASSSSARGSQLHRLSQATNSHRGSHASGSHEGRRHVTQTVLVASTLAGTTPGDADDYASDTASEEPPRGEINLAPGQLPPYFSPASTFTGVSPRMDPSPQNSLKANGSFHLDMHNQSFPDLEMLGDEGNDLTPPGSPPLGILSTEDAAKILGYLPEDVRGAVGQWLPSSIWCAMRATGKSEKRMIDLNTDFWEWRKECIDRAFKRIIVKTTRDPPHPEHAQYWVPQDLLPQKDALELLSLGADWTGFIGHDDWKAQHWAAAHGAPILLEQLIKLGAQVDEQTSLHRTPLMLAAITGHHDCMSVLLNKGADISIADNVERTALNYADRRGHPMCASLIKSWGPQEV